ncbi:MAG: radical SAM protein [Woeseiaceae bacterium]
MALTRELLRELKAAGVAGFTFHIDSKQGRPKWKQRNEIELNELRLSFAEMLAEVGGLSCAFNSTVYADTLRLVPDLVDWAAKHIDIVHAMVFIAFRQAVPEMPVDFYAGGQKIDMDTLVYASTEPQHADLLSTDIVRAIRERFADFAPCAYLNGTKKPDAFKWLLSVRVGTKHRIHGYLGAKFIELVQTQYHFWKGTYLAYSSPSVLRFGKSVMLLSPFDRGARHAAASYMGSLWRNPLRLFHKMYFQSVMIIQPVDMLEDGGLNMCDGCPDVTTWNGKLVWSCRLEELKQFGCFVRAVPTRIDGACHRRDRSVHEESGDA